MGKIGDIQLKSPIISAAMKVIHGGITNRKSQVADRSVSVSMTLSDLERWDARDCAGDSPYLPFDLERHTRHGNICGSGTCFNESATPPSHGLAYRHKQKDRLMLTNPCDAFRGQSRSPSIVPFHIC